MAKKTPYPSSADCDDCGAPYGMWASINRAVFLCDECSSIHRSLGKHISYIRCLDGNNWPSNQLQMLRTLHDLGSNKLWEHSLAELTNIKNPIKKPTDTDSLKDKEKFIKAKYKELAFTNKYASRDDLQPTELNKQLHLAVCQQHLEVALKYLSLGADPDFIIDDENDVTILHEAAASGFPLLAELLLIYGANPNAKDCDGRTPADYAWDNKHDKIAERIVEVQYEVISKIIHFVSGKKPDHKIRKVFPVPELPANVNIQRAEHLKDIRKLFSKLSNRQFENLVADIYDELERRDAEMAAPKDYKLKSLPVGFLPNNTDLSMTRNQTRQKLGLVTGVEFTTLLYDIWYETYRRQEGKEPFTKWKESQFVETVDDISGMPYSKKISTENNSINRDAIMEANNSEEITMMQKLAMGNDELRRISNIAALPSERKVKTQEQNYQQILEYISNIWSSLQDIRKEVNDLKQRVDDKERNQTYGMNPYSNSYSSTGFINQNTNYGNTMVPLRNQQLSGSYRNSSQPNNYLPTNGYGMDRVNSISHLHQNVPKGINMNGCRSVQELSFNGSLPENQMSIPDGLSNDVKLRSAGTTDQSTARPGPPGYDETMSNGRTESLLFEENGANFGNLQGERITTDASANENFSEYSLLANGNNYQKGSIVGENKNTFEQQLFLCYNKLQELINALNLYVANKEVSNFWSSGVAILRACTNFVSCVDQSNWILDAFIRTKCVFLKSNAEELINFCKEPGDQALDPKNIQCIMRYSRGLDQSALEIVHICSAPELPNNVL